MVQFFETDFLRVEKIDGPIFIVRLGNIKYKILSTGKYKINVWLESTSISFLSLAFSIERVDVRAGFAIILLQKKLNLTKSMIILKNNLIDTLLRS